MTLNVTAPIRGTTPKPEGACGCCEWPHTVGRTVRVAIFERDYDDRVESSFETDLCDNCLKRSAEKGVLYPIRDNGFIAGACEWYVEGKVST